MSEDSDIERQFASHGMHPYVLFAVPFGLCLVGIGVAGIVAMGASGWSYVAIGVFALAFGAAALLSSAFSLWGRMTVTRQGDRITVTRSLGSMRRSRDFFVRQVRFVERYDPGPGALVFPDGAGTHVRVFVERRERPLAIGEGLSLDDGELREVEAILGWPDRVASSD